MHNAAKLFFNPINQFDLHLFSMSKRLNVSGWNFLTFPIDTLTKDFRGENSNFFRGYPHFGPPKPVSDQKWLLMTSYDPPILMQNLFWHKKWGCLKKLELYILKNDRAMAMSSLEKEISKISKNWLGRQKFW